MDLNIPLLIQHQGKQLSTQFVCLFTINLEASKNLLFPRALTKKMACQFNRSKSYRDSFLLFGGRGKTLVMIANIKLD
jgi:hypothetical protein